MDLEPGRTIAHYRIDRKIGEGGMGVVYVAEDTRLGRRVALKILPADVAADSERRARFEREARALAALNHPNIVTVHSVEEAGGVSFLTMELVSGRPLRALLAPRGLPFGQVLDLSIGIAEALEVAHRHGVVHRDLKPDNVMLTDDGRIKVLDFGLAKLREPIAGPGATGLPTRSITEAGKILGTVAYLSPEQAEGKPLDQRSDIFAFGVVLYEMATGRRPFRGDTAIATISAILKDTPPPAHQVNPALPTEVGHIVRRCLAKEPGRRYQSTADLLNELRELKEDSDSGGLTREQVTAAGGVGRLSGAPRVSRAALGVAALALLALGIVAGWVFSRRALPVAAVDATSASIQLTRATTDGKVEEAALSPDGRYLAYVRCAGETCSLRLRQVMTGDEVQIVTPSETDLKSPVFSADGNFLNYVSIETNHPTGWAYRVSVLGGTPRRLVDDVFAVAPSPDGRRLLLNGGTVNHWTLSVGGADGEDARVLATRTGEDHFDSNGSWSSDGRSIAIVSHKFGSAQEIVLIDPDTGRETSIATPTLHTIDDVAFIPARDALIAAGSERAVVNQRESQIFEVRKTGDMQPLTHDLNAYSSLSMTSDGSTVAAVQKELQSGIEVAAVAGGMPGAFTELYPVSASLAGFGLSWLDGTHLAHGMLQGNEMQFFVTEVDSKTTHVLTSGPSHYQPVPTRDGRSLLALRADGDRGNLWVVDAQTGRERRLTDGRFDAFAVISGDGQSVFFTSATQTLMKVPLAGGAPVEFRKTAMRCAGLSADGRDLLCIRYDTPEEVAPILLPIAGGEARPIPGLPPSRRLLHYGPDGRSIDYVLARDGADELWSLPAPGGAPKRFARFDGAEIQDYAWSPDGSRLAVTRQTRSGNVVLLKRKPS